MKLSKRTIAVTTVVFALAGTGGALAYVTATGSGTGNGSTIAASSVQAVEVIPVAASLSPGATVPFTYTGTNNNSFTVTLKAPVTISVSGLPAGCATTNFEIIQPTGLAISASDSVTATTYGSVKLIEDTVDACLGATPTYTLATAP